MAGASGAWQLLGIILVTVVVVLAAVAAAGGGLWLIRSRTPRPPLPPTPEEILQRRYAAGRIDEDEYLRRLSGITNT